MCKNIGGGTVASKMQGSRPKQGVEIQNIFADEVVLLGRAVWLYPLIKIQTLIGAVL